MTILPKAIYRFNVQFSSVQSLSRVQLFATPWIAAHQASLSITNSRSSLRLTSIRLVMPSSHLILCHPLLLLPPIPPSIRVFLWVNSLHEMAKVLEFQQGCAYPQSLGPASHPDPPSASVSEQPFIPLTTGQLSRWIIGCMLLALCLREGGTQYQLKPGPETGYWGWIRHKRRRQWHPTGKSYGQRSLVGPQEGEQCLQWNSC